MSYFTNTNISPQSSNPQLDFGFKSRALWTCVIVPKYQEYLIGHILPIQPLDWAQNSSKLILYPTFSIKWSNFKSYFGTRWTHVLVSTYHKTSITWNIQYSSKRVMHYINLSKNWENDLQNTTQNLQNDPNGFACDFWLLCCSILKLETDKAWKLRKP